MADHSLIEWTDATWNPVSGCTPVSEGCRNCYAKRMARRFPHLHNASIPSTMAREENFREVIFHPGRLDQPLRWKKPRRIFVCSMGDLFHEDVTDEQIQAVFGVMSSAGQHTYMVLTKRPQRMKEWMEKTSLAECQAEMVARDIEMRSPKGRRDRIGDSTINGPWPLPTVMLGVTAENQEMADQRIPILLQTPAAKRFVSVEPMLGAVDLGAAKGLPVWWEEKGIPYRDGWSGRTIGHAPESKWHRHNGNMQPWLDWVITGPETGPHRRPSPPGAFRSLKDQCVAAGVPFFLKALDIGGKIVKMPTMDGCVWDQIPEVER